MKKRRKNQNQQAGQPGSFTPSGVESVPPASAADLELEPGAEEEPGAESTADSTGLEPAASEAVVAADAVEMASPETTETMDELLAELLALDLDALTAPASVEAAADGDTAISAVELQAAGEPVEAERAQQAESLEVLSPEPPSFASLADASLADASLAEDPQFAESAALTEAPAEQPGQELLAAEPEEPVLSEQQVMEQRAWDDAPSFDTADMSPEPEEMFEPLPPQPALEAVVGTIDRALQSAPAVIAPIETPAHHKQFSQLDDYIVFSLSGSDYAVPVRDVAEIGRIPGVTRIPNVPDFVRGITNLRGEVVPVLNLPVLLGLQDTAPSARGRIVFLQARDPISPTGLIVDEVKGIQRIQSQQLEQVTGLVDDKVTSVLRGVHGRGERLLNVLDLEQLFQLEEVRELAVR